MVRHRQREGRSKQGGKGHEYKTWCTERGGDGNRLGYGTRREVGMGKRECEPVRVRVQER
jgi:hypothetical protein